VFSYGFCYFPIAFQSFFKGNKIAGFDGVIPFYGSDMSLTVKDVALFVEVLIYPGKFAFFFFPNRPFVDIAFIEFGFVDLPDDYLAFHCVFVFEMVNKSKIRRMVVQLAKIIKTEKEINI
jgi:hypothetical protein